MVVQYKCYSIGRLEIALNGAHIGLSIGIVNNTLQNHRSTQIFLSDEYGDITKLEEKKLTLYSYNFRHLKDEIRNRIMAGYLSGYEKTNYYYTGLILVTGAILKKSFVKCRNKARV